MKKKHWLLLTLGIQVALFMACTEKDETLSYSCVDADGNSYKTVVIGNQVWMAENLKATHYQSGAEAYLASGSTIWTDQPVGMRYYTHNNLNYFNTYGYLYNWYVIQNDNIAPEGWRIPTEEDWQVLENYLRANGFSYDQSDSSDMIAKALATKTYWKTCSLEGAVGCNLSLNNATGFSALPGGYRTDQGTFYYEKEASCFWTATRDSATNKPYRKVLYYDRGELFTGSLDVKSACYIRCVRDVE